MPPFKQSKKLLLKRAEIARTKRAQNAEEAGKGVISVSFDHMTLILKPEPRPELEAPLPNETLEVNEQGDGNDSSLDIIELSATEFFSPEVQNVQQQASAAERHKKRAHAPQKKPDRTLRRYKKAKRDLEAQGFLSVPEFFKLKAKKTGQQEAINVAQSDDADESQDKINDAEDMGNMSGKDAASVHALEEEEEASNAENGGNETRTKVCNTKGRAVSIEMLLEEEEEEEEAENDADKTNEVRSTIRAKALSGRDSSGPELVLEPCLGWGPSRTVLYESEGSSGSESSSSSSSGDSLSVVSDHDDLHNTRSKELEGVRFGNIPDDTATQQPMVSVPELLRDRAELQRVQGELSLKAKGKGLDTVLHSRVVAMVGLLNLFLDRSLDVSWKRASEIVAKSEGRGTTRARSIRQWVANFVRTRELPSHQHGRIRMSVLNDEVLAQEIKRVLGEKAKISTFLTAADVQEVVSSPDIQAQFTQAGINRPSISKSTACRWLGKLGWRHGRHQNGMYFDGHEREDVVEYRKGFVRRFKEYERRFHTWDDEGNELPRPSGFHVPGAVGRFRLVLITHDESTFYQNDQRKIYWSCPGRNVPKPKGDGQTLMVSDFLSADWGPLRDADRCVACGLLPSNLTYICTVKPGFCSGLGRTGMAGSQPMICLPRSTTQSTSLRGSLGVMRRAFFSSTTRPAIKSVQTMHFRLGGWSKVRNFLFLRCSISSPLRAEGRVDPQQQRRSHAERLFPPRHTTLLLLPR
jgi:hypothetical protein